MSPPSRLPSPFPDPVCPSDPVLPTEPAGATDFEISAPGIAPGRQASSSDRHSSPAWTISCAPAWSAVEMYAAVNPSPPKRMVSLRTSLGPRTIWRHQDRSEETSEISPAPARPDGRRANVRWIFVVIMFSLHKRHQPRAHTARATHGCFLVRDFVDVVNCSKYNGAFNISFIENRSK